MGEHGSFNRISSGDASWKYIIAHGCTVWIPYSNPNIASIESWQYKVAKLILITNMNIPKSALFVELEWESTRIYIVGLLYKSLESINNYLDRQRVSYFARIKKLQITRLQVSSHGGRT